MVSGRREEAGGGGARARFVTVYFSVVFPCSPFRVEEERRRRGREQVRSRGVTHGLEEKMGEQVRWSRTWRVRFGVVVPCGGHVGRVTVEEDDKHDGLGGLGRKAGSEREKGKGQEKSWVAPRYLSFSLLPGKKQRD